MKKLEGLVATVTAPDADTDSAIEAAATAFVAARKEWAWRLRNTNETAALAAAHLRLNWAWKRLVEAVERTGKQGT